MANTNLRADLLKPGDIFHLPVMPMPGAPWTAPADNRLLLIHLDAESMTAHCVDLGAQGYPKGKRHLSGGMYVWVEAREAAAPELTPAQQHAEELLALVRGVMDAGQLTPVRDAARALLDKIDPPAPPTVDELLLALADAARWANLNVDRLDPEDRDACDRSEKALHALLDRARRAGMLPIAIVPRETGGK